MVGRTQVFFTFILLFFGVFPTLQVSPAQDLAGERRLRYLLFQLDNDLFTGSDQNYTSGVRVAYLQQISPETMNAFQAFLKNLGKEADDTVGVFFSQKVQPSKTEYDWGVGLTQLMFTPEDHELLFAPPGKRPYAGWLGLEFSVHAKNEKALVSMLLSVGTTGKASIAEESQEYVHTHISGSPIFQGWDSQVPQEITINLHFDSKVNLGKTSAGGIDFDGYWEWGATLGNFRTDAFTGLLFRGGWNLPIQYMTPRIQLGSYSHELFVGDRTNTGAWSIFGLAGGRGTAVAHDITLDGPWFRDFDGAVGSKPLVAEAIIGFGARYQRFTVTYARTFRTNEFGGQEGGHQFGSVQASLGW